MNNSSMDPTNLRTMTPTEVFEAASKLTRELDTARRAEFTTRMNLLRLHGWKGLIVGILILLGGAPQTFENNIGLWTRPCIGLLGLFAGAMLLVGVNRENYDDSSTTLQTIGLLAIGFWDFSMTVGLILGMALYDGPWQIYLPWQVNAIPVEQPRPYGFIIYGVMTIMVWVVHLRAVRRYRAFKDAL